MFYSWFESLVNKIYLFFYEPQRAQRAQRRKKGEREIGLILGGGGFLRL
jgi:hypothetical protein